MRATFAQVFPQSADIEVLHPMLTERPGAGQTKPAVEDPHMLRNVQTLGVAVFLLGASTSHGSPTQLAPIQVSLVIQERCEIQSAAESASAVAPGVSCLHGAPYSVALAPRDPTQPLSTLQLAGRIMQRAVWTVAF
jgi:hypothetical protein